MFGQKKKGPSSPLINAVDGVTGESRVGVSRSVEKLIDQGTATLADLMSTPRLNEHQAYIDYSDGLCTVLSIAWWPENLNVGWIRGLLTQNDMKIDLSMHVHTVPRGIIEDWLNQRGSSMAETIEAEESRGKPVKTLLSKQQQDINTMKEMINVAGEDFFQMTLLVSVYGDTIDELKRNVKDVIALLHGVGLEAKPMIEQQRGAIASVLPWGLDQVKTFHNFYTTALATAFPFLTGTLRADDGVWYGYTNNSEMLFFDNFRKDKAYGNSFNKVVIGSTGSGKSFWTKVMASRYALRGVEVFVIDPGKQEEYRRFSDYLGGAHIEISPSSQTVLNPFDIAVVKERIATTATGEVMDDADRPNVMTEKITYLLGLFSLMGGDGLTDLDHVMLDEMIRLVYRMKGIIGSDESTYSHEPPTMQDFDEMLKILYYVSKLDEVKMKQIQARLESDHAWANTITGLTCRHYLHAVKEVGEAYSADKIESINHIRVMLGQYLQGSKAGLFRGKTTLRADKQVVVFRVGGCPEDQINLAMYIVFGEVYNRVLAGGGSRNKIVVIDEAWKLLAQPSTARSVQTLIREGRKMGTGTWILSQEVSDFLDREEGKTAVGQSNVRILLRTGSSDEAEKARKHFNLPAAATARMPSFSGGHGILSIVDKTFEFTLAASDRERLMASTTPDEIARLEAQLGEG